MNEQTSARSERTTEVQQGIVKWGIKATIGLIIYGLILFLSAGTLNWIWGWIFLGVLAIHLIAHPLLLVPRNPELLVEREKGFLAKEVKHWDKRLTSLAGGLMMLTWVIAGLDYRFRWTGQLALIYQLGGLLVTILGYGIFMWAMTTNAFLLPQRVDVLKQAGLRRITISLDSLDEDIFRRMNGGKAGVQQVLAGIQAAEQAGFSPLKINTVVQRGKNDHTIVELARFFKERGHIVRFIEYMDVGNLNGWRMDQVVPGNEIAARIHAEMPLEPLNPNYPGEVATRYRSKDGEGEIGLITSVTRPFCANCNRMRLSAEGQMYTCLFASKGTDLRNPLRNGTSDKEIEQIISDAWISRIDRYSEQRFKHPRTHKKPEMFHLG